MMMARSPTYFRDRISNEEIMLRTREILRPEYGTDTPVPEVVQSGEIVFTVFKGPEVRTFQALTELGWTCDSVTTVDDTTEYTFRRPAVHSLSLTWLASNALMVGGVIGIAATFGSMIYGYTKNAM